MEELPSEKNLHTGHRSRLRNRYLQEGLKNFEPHNILELLLFYSIPRADTNELAHRLLQHFGSLSEVFDADIDALMEVEGIGLQSATLLHMIPALSGIYRLDKFFPAKTPMTLSTIGAYLVEYFSDKSEEIMVLLLLDNSRRIISCEELFRGSVDCVSFDPKKTVGRLLSKKAHTVVLAHNHPRGNPIPSREDLEATETLKRLLDATGIHLEDHIVVAGGTWISILNETAGEPGKVQPDETARYWPIMLIEPQKPSLRPAKEH